MQTSGYLADVSAWLGKNSFQQENYAQAVEYYEALLRVSPDSELASERLARSHLALDNPQAARPYLRTLSDNNPGNATYSALLERTNEQLTYGSEASRAYRAALSKLDAGNLSGALADLRTATSANSDFLEAFILAGETAQALGEPAAALPYWQRVVALEPGNEAAQVALTVAEGQSRYGERAYAAYRAGVSAHEAGRTAEAQRNFQEAVSASDTYADAWAWLGRIAFEAEAYEDASRYYNEARTLEPGNTTYATNYAQSLDLAAQQQEAARLEAERERAEAERLAQEAERAAEAERLAQAEAERLAAEAERLAQEEAQRLAAEAEADAEAQAEAEAEAERQAEAERRAEAEAAAEEAARLAEQAAEAARAAEQERLDRERELAEEAQRLAAEAEAEAAAQAEAERLAAEAEAEAAAEAEAERLAAEAAARAEASAQAEASATGGDPVDLLTADLTHQTGRATEFFSAPETLNSNLNQPVNYAGGTVHQRVEVLSKPSDAPVVYQLCLVPVDISATPACSSSGLTFSRPGVYETEQPLNSFSNYGGINWDKGIVDVMVVIKDEAGRPVDNSYFLAQNAQAPDLDDYYPMSVRYDAVITPAGGSFQGW